MEIRPNRSGRVGIGHRLSDAFFRFRSDGGVPPLDTRAGMPSAAAGRAGDTGNTWAMAWMWEDREVLEA